MNIDILSPEYLGEDRIDLERLTIEPVAGLPVRFSISYDRCAPEGVVLPIDIVVTTPDESFTKTFSHSPPRSFVFVPDAAGEHSVIVREQAHNRWVGIATFFVVAAVHQLEDVEPGRR